MLEDLLAADFLPVYGTPLTASSFQPLLPGTVIDEWHHECEGWFVEALSDDGQAVTYFVLVEHPVLESPAQSNGCLSAVCLALPGHGHYDTQERQSGDPLVLQSWEHHLQHPYRKRSGVRAPVAEWVGAVMTADATGRRAMRGSQWDGESLEAMGVRAEYGIVEYRDFEASIDMFFDFNEVREWLDTALQGTGVKVELATIGHYPLAADGRLRKGMLLRMMQDDQAYSWVPLPVTTQSPLDGWFTGELYPHDAKQMVCVQSASVSTSGAQLLSSSAEYALSWAELCEEAVLHRDEPTQHSAIREAGLHGDWLVLHVIGTDIALPIARKYSHLAIRVDNDGSTVQFEVHPSAERCEHHLRRDYFQRRWGKWLDEHAVLTDEELSEGRARAELALRLLLEMAQ